MNKFTTTGSNVLDSKKIDKYIDWLKEKRLQLEKESKTFVWVDIVNIETKMARKRLFYYADLKVAPESYSYIERRFNPFIIRENKSFKVNYVMGTCIKCESDIEFRMVFDKDPHLEVDERYKLETVVPVNIISRQIDFMNNLKVSDSDLKRIVYGTYKPKPYKDNTPSISSKLNSPQKKAVKHAFNCQDFHLILGPPGTGKTTIIQELCRLFVENDEKVLLTSWMNVAVDNALEAVIKDDVIDKRGIYRIGAGDYKVSEDVLPFTITGGSTRVKDDIKDASLVGTTLASAYKTGEPENPPFDVVIVDEAGTATISQTLLALGLAKKFILIGDHLQLPPIITGDNTPYWLKESQFEKLWNLYESKRSVLDIQYRMSPPIANIASKTVYSELGGIKNSKLINERSYPFKNLQNQVKKSKLINRLLNQDYSVVWINSTDDASWINDGGTPSANNITEIEKIEKILDIFINKCNINSESIGILSPFRYQISSMVNTFENYIDEGVDVNTIHSFQGDEKDIIIISLVADSPRASKIYDDIRLMNVAVTRSKFKLIVVGNSKMCNYKDDLSKMLNLVKFTALKNDSYFESDEVKSSENKSLRTKNEYEKWQANQTKEVTKEHREIFKNKPRYRYKWKQ